MVAAADDVSLRSGDSTETAVTTMLSVPKGNSKGKKISSGLARGLKGHFVRYHKAVQQKLFVYDF